VGLEKTNSDGMTPSYHWVREPEVSRQSGYSEEIISGPAISGIQDVQPTGY